jgi:hypothetical protein
LGITLAKTAGRNADPDADGETSLGHCDHVAVADVRYGRNGLNQLMPGYLSPIAYEALMIKKTETT